MQEAVDVRAGALVAVKGRRFRAVEIVAGVVFAGILAFVLVGPLVVSYSPREQRFQDGAFLAPGAAGHLLGTDQLARDQLSRLAYGGRTSLLIALAAVGLGLVLGMLIGFVAGMRGGWVDTGLMRTMDALMAFPALVLALVVATALEPSVRTTVLAISVVITPGFARLTRSLALRERGREYVHAVRATGASSTRIARVHVLPNIWAPIATQAILTFGHAIPAEAALSFLGLGVPLPEPSWGSMIAEAYAYLTISPWGIVLPAMMIVLTVASASILGDAVRRHVDEEG